jgi:PAS domain S-box-containing protein
VSINSAMTLTSLQRSRALTSFSFAAALYFAAALMNALRRRCAVFLLGFCGVVSSTSVIATQADIRFNHLSRQQGLSQSFILSVAQDKNGFMWFGSQAGLNRFDGYEVKIFRRDESEGSLPGSTVRALLSDSKGRLWVGTENGGFSQYQFESETFTTYNAENSQLPTNRIRSLHEDARGQIWVGTDGGGLWRFDPRLKEFHSATPKFEDESIFAIASGNGGELWVAMRSGLYEVTFNRGLIPALAGQQAGDRISGVHIRAILQTLDGTLWIGTENEGAFRIAADGSYEHFVVGEASESISGMQVSSILQDDRGDIWLATSGGLDHVTQDGIVSHLSDPANPWSLSNDIVVDLFQDEGGVMWVATFGGLNYWSRSEYLAGHVSANQRVANSLSSSAVAAISESSDGTVWVGTFRGGLNEILPSGLIRHHRADVDDPASIPEDTVMSLYVDSKERVWVGTRSAGLAVFDADRGLVKLFDQSTEVPFQLSSNAITSITESEYGEILVGTYGGGLNRIDLNNFEVTSIQASRREGSLQSNRIMTVFEDRTGHLWLGTDGSGLVYYDRYREKFTHFDNDEVSGFMANFVMQIAEDSGGNLYFGTLNGGLFRLDSEHQMVDQFQFEQITEQNGLSSNIVYGLLVDDFDQVWLSSNTGLNRYDPATGGVSYLGLSNALQDLEFNAGAAHKLLNGELLFGGVNGFNRIDPTHVETNTHVPSVAITSVAKQGEQYSPALLGAKGIELSHQDYVLEFRFAGLDYANAMMNQYRYRLIGLDESWIEAGTRRYASYTNLNQGRYVFEVLAANSDGVWGTTPARIAVNVAPAPWFSWWAFVSYAIGVCLLVLLTYRARRVRLDHVAEVQSINLRLRQEVDVRKEQEAQVNIEREKTQRYLDVAEVALVALDVEGTVLHINEKADGTFNSVAEPILGRSLMELVNVQQRNALRQKILSVFDGEDSGEHLECDMSAANGSSRTMIWRFAPLTETGGHANMILGSGTDITELRHLEKSVQFREKLSALGTLSAGIAHDFNNILTAIAGYSSLALEQVRGQGEVEEFIQHIESATERATALVARILSMSQSDESQFEPVDMPTLAHEAVGLLRGTLPTNINIEESYPEIPIVVNGDPGQIHQLFVNLGTNAVNAMQSNGGVLKFVISRRDIDQEGIPNGSNLAAGVYIILDVIDTGKGMPEVMKSRIFDPFYSSDSHGVEGRSTTGLGLSVVHGIVQAHRGYIDVKSVVGSGTQFRIYLPEGEASSASVVVQLRQPIVNKRRVMLVDDEEWVVDITSRLLTMLGHDVQTFTHPAEALAQFKATPDAYKVVITDQNMPQIKGTELIDQLRRIKSETKVILMSGNVSPLHEVDDNTRFMAKPFKVDNLKNVLAALGINDGEKIHGKGSS